MKNKLTSFGVIFLSVISYISEGQILKVNKGSLDADSSGYFLGSIDVNFNLNNRSTTAEKEVVFKGLDGAADLIYISKKHAYILINNINYFTSTGGPLISTGYAHLRLNFFRKKSYRMSCLPKCSMMTDEICLFAFCREAVSGLICWSQRIQACFWELVSCMKRNIGRLFKWTTGLSTKAFEKLPTT